MSVSHVTGFPPPSTLKVGITAIGGYAAEMHWFMAGLDIHEKAEMLKKQALSYLDKKQFTTITFDLYGTPGDNPSSLKKSMVHLRIFAQSKDKCALEPHNFLFPILNNALQSYPAATWNNDFRLAQPREYVEYWPALLDRRKVPISVHLSNGSIIDIEEPTISYFDASHLEPEAKHPHVVTQHKDDDELVEARLGDIVFARSGDKATNCNIGLFVRNKAHWEWFKHFMSTEKMIELLEDDYANQEIERVEFEDICLIHFLLRGYLGKGVSSTSSYDCLGKNVAEYVRYKKVMIPKKLMK